MKPHFKDPDAYKLGEILLPDKAIDARLDELSEELVKEYKKKHLLLVGLLTGAAWLTVDLFRKLHILGVTDAEITFMKVNSYKKETVASYDPRIEYDTSIDPKERHVLLIDDIADTGRTMEAVMGVLWSKDVASLKTLVLLDKPSRREVVYRPNYVGFEIPNIWVQGRGMDSDGYGRGDPNIRKGPYHY
jgi:hypoxanthine phosphoribosyltransferase